MSEAFTKSTANGFAIKLIPHSKCKLNGIHRVYVSYG